MITAIVDESNLAPINGAAGFLEAYSNLTDLIKKIKKDDVSLLKHSSIWECAVSENLKLFEVLFEKKTDLDDDIRELFFRELDGLSNCDATDGVPSARDFSLSLLREHRACGLVVIPCRDRVEKIENYKLFSVGNKESALAFYRAANELGDFTEGDLIENGKRAFPSLFFRENIAAQISKFSESYLPSMRPKIVQALSDLNDYLPAVLAETKHAPDVENRFNALSQFSISPESPNTRRNASAIKERDVTVEKRGPGGAVERFTVRCEWHLKIHATRDRIHFHFGVPAIAGNKIIIGIFCDHLTV